MTEEIDVLKAVAPGRSPSGPPWVGYLLNQIAGRIRALTAGALEPLGLTPPMLRALEATATHQPLTQVQLGGRINMDRTTVVHVVDRFEVLGYVRREPHPSDRRSYSLGLTREGEAALEEARRLAREAEDTTLAPLSSEDRAQLVRLLVTLHHPTPLFLRIET